MEKISYDPESDESIYDQLTDQSENAAQLALAMLNNTIGGTAHLRADVAYVCGKQKEYRPDWTHERVIVSQRLDQLGINPENALTEERWSEYRESWIGRFEVVHEGGHHSLVLDDPALDIPDRARP